MTPSPSADPGARLFVAFSELAVPEAGRAAVDDAFAHRLGAVDGWPGFRGLEVWADVNDPCTLIMVSWWDNCACFTAYMHSDDHRESHQRIPEGEQRPRARRFSRYEVIAR